ncbi:Hint domain-containing protein [Yoonia sp.]|uniref:Hint domain-containing protein n=1 Tax=Yoonia sp. TaxID=2212373 RepID=UPI0025F4C7DB|nr:Hint domain-containing protein [Yoonia sp.]
MIIPVYNAEHIVVTGGAALGEPISFSDELVLDDVYQLRPNGQLVNLDIMVNAKTGVFTSRNHHGQRFHLDCCLTLMTHAGLTQEALILVAVTDDEVDAVYLLPLAQLEPQVDYRLIGIERHTATRRFAQAGCGAFGGGTRITLSDGRLCPVENLAAGDLVLTRDHGPQHVRWIEKTTLRACGSFAPVVINKGVLNNDADLVVRADHRLFVYQRVDYLRVGRAEVLIKASQMIDDDGIYLRQGGFIDYFQLVFDAHYLIFAEGICAETQRIDALSRPGLHLAVNLPDHPPSRILSYDVATDLIASTQAADLLRRASAG